VPAHEDEQAVPARRDLMRPYERPVRHVLGATWRRRRDLQGWTALIVGLWVVGGGGVAAGQPLLGLLAGTASLLAFFVIVAWLFAGARESWRLTRAWAQKSELRTVRERRPQAGEIDPDVAHDEFAVTVEDDGWLLTWRLRPLAIAEQPGVDEIEVPGRPRYAASAISDQRFDVLDAAVAAEQLVAAQERAAALERDAIATARSALADAERRAELAVEARSTAAALQRPTGQRSRRD
jgi:hypothetical protein